MATSPYDSRLLFCTWVEGRRWKPLGPTVHVYTYIRYAHCNLCWHATFRTMLIESLDFARKWGFLIWAVSAAVRASRLMTVTVLKHMGIVMVPYARWWMDARKAHAKALFIQEVELPTLTLSIILMARTSTFNGHSGWRFPSSEMSCRIA